MSATNGQCTASPAVVAGVRPVVLVRQWPGVGGETSRMVHVVPLPLVGEAGVALCGALLCPDEVETVHPGHGVPCSLCLIRHISAGSPPTPAGTPATPDPAEVISSDTTPLAAAAGYRLWGWPVVLRGDRVWLNLEPDTVAVIIPIPLVERVIAILSQRRCPPLVLANPDTPEHRVLLAGERYGVALPWPPGVRRSTGTVPLPPTMTPCGPVTWVYPPEHDALALCREVDVFAALRTALYDPPT
ncbi:MAG: hypothetical protein WBV74_12860 [Pseudonocardiaceae bacterium]